MVEWWSSQSPLCKQQVALGFLQTVAERSSGGHNVDGGSYRKRQQMLAGSFVTEGVTKFSAIHVSRAIPERPYQDAAHTLRAWRQVLFALRLVGQDDHLYDGAGYGNLSARVGVMGAEQGQRQFLVSGTQTGAQPMTEFSDWTLVTRYDLRKNCVYSEGLIAPSSESLTHGAIYDLSSRIRFVLHVHSPSIWQARRTLRLPCTDENVEYGTPAMARAVRSLYENSHLAQCQVFAMGGHQDGIVSFGHSCDEAGHRLISIYAQALRLALATTTSK